ncbi:MAG TPA: hypothetical protein VGJ02_04435 [Pyrinomonadaceae bacterium]|jgi:hypothetical protein
MIRMESPSFAFNSVDVPGPVYHFWHTLEGASGYSTPQLVDKIISINRMAIEMKGSPLRNIVINSHGWDGGGGISIGGSGNWEASIRPGSVGAFSQLKGLNLGTIWLVACQAARGADGKALCQAIARNSGSQVVAADDDQDVGIWEGWRVLTSLYDNIDEFEGTVYSFTPVGGIRMIDPHADIYTIME